MSSSLVNEKPSPMSASKKPSRSSSAKKLKDPREPRALSDAPAALLTEPPPLICDEKFTFLCLYCFVLKDMFLALVC
jgi:hypothetical protein